MKKIIIILFSLVLVSSVSVAQWVPLQGAVAGDILDLHVFNSNIYAGGAAYLFRSTNNGNNWTSHLTQLAYAWSIASSGTNIYCGVWNSAGQPSGVYKSTNNGVNWSATSLINNNISDLVATDQRIIACAFVDNKIYMSTNGGTNWTIINGSLSYGIYTLAISGSRIYAAAQGLHMTSNDGVNWSPLFMSDNVESVSASDSLLIIGTNSHGVYRSSDYGQTWARTLNLDKKIISVFQYGNYVFAGADTGFYASNDGGISFIDKAQGLGNASISSIAINNNYIFVSNSNYLSTNVAVWRRPIQEIFGVRPISSQIPSSYILYQNFPNPFNPATTIRFSVPAKSDARIEVKDITGRTVTVLFSGNLNAGSYETSWDASNNASGIYFVQLTSGSFRDTKKMVLVK